MTDRVLVAFHVSTKRQLQYAIQLNLPASTASLANRGFSYGVR